MRSSATNRACPGLAPPNLCWTKLLLTWQRLVAWQQQEMDAVRKKNVSRDQLLAKLQAWLDSFEKHHKALALVAGGGSTSSGAGPSSSDGPSSSAGPSSGQKRVHDGQGLTQGGSSRRGGASRRGGTSTRTRRPTTPNQSLCLVVLFKRVKPGLQLGPV